VLYNTLEALRIATILLTPVLPAAAERVWEQLGIDAPLASLRLADTRWGGLPAGTRTRPGAPIFPRIEARPAPVEAGTSPQVRDGSSVRSVDPATSRAAAPRSAATKRQKSPQGGTAVGEITIDDFNKVDLRVAEILEAKRVAGADKLLELQIAIGDSTRTLVAGIAEEYAPEALVGRKIIVVANLQPRRLRGVESQGMLLAANDGARAVLLAPDRDVPSGVRVS
jgi:methionyl-tRNA synthetase